MMIDLERVSVQHVLTIYFAVGLVVAWSCYFYRGRMGLSADCMTSMAAEVFLCTGFGVWWPLTVVVAAMEWYDERSNRCG